jgi:uncharacterized damage-inducible protein DinB
MLGSDMASKRTGGRPGEPDVDSSALLVDAFDRIRALVHKVVEGLTVQQLAVRLDADANTICWLVWHLTRVQDDHVAAVAGTEQAWTAQGWSDRFALPFAAGSIGYGHSSEQVAAVRADAELLAAYHDATAERTLDFVRGLSDRDLDRVIDRRWDPPVTLGVRLVSVVSDDLQHVGQAAFIRGIVLRS